MRPRSLSSRLVFSLIAVQVLAVLGWIAVLMTVSPYVSYDELAAASAADRVAAAAEFRTADEVLIKPSAAFARYAARRPGFRYAIVAEQRVLLASDAAFEQMLWAAGPRRLTVGRQQMADGSQVVLDTRKIGERTATIAISGHRFGPEDAGRFFTSYAPQFLLMFGPAVLAGALVTPWVVRSALRPLRDAASQAERVGIEDGVHALDGGRLPLEVAPFALAMSRLVTRMRESAAAQRLFLANAAHETRTPMTILSARVEALAASRERDLLRTDVRRLSTLLDQLLSASRLQAGAGDREPIDVAALVRETAADLAPLALRIGRRIHVDITSAPEAYRGDADALRSALTNLIENALRAEPEGGVVSVRVDVERGNLWIYVSDHGAGVPAEDAEMIFQPFRRGRQASGRAGLGLAIVRAVAEWHGGSADVTAGPGGRFHLRLPLDPPAVAVEDRDIAS
ncbi:MAG: sensor histidine kinase [Brevundimonas sp.]